MSPPSPSPRLPGALVLGGALSCLVACSGGGGGGGGGPRSTVEVGDVQVTSLVAEEPTGFAGHRWPIRIGLETTDFLPEVGVDLFFADAEDIAAGVARPRQFMHTVTLHEVEAGSRTETFHVPLPATLSESKTWQVLARVDGLGLVGENNEGNNFDETLGTSFFLDGSESTRPDFVLVDARPSDDVVGLRADPVDVSEIVQSDGTRVSDLPNALLSLDLQLFATGQGFFDGVPVDVVLDVPDLGQPASFVGPQRLDVLDVSVGAFVPSPLRLPRWTAGSETDVHLEVAVPAALRDALLAQGQDFVAPLLIELDPDEEFNQLEGGDTEQGEFDDGLLLDLTVIVIDDTLIAEGPRNIQEQGRDRFVLPDPINDAYFLKPPGGNLVELGYEYELRTEMSSTGILGSLDADLDCVLFSNLDNPNMPLEIDSAVKVDVEDSAEPFAFDLEIRTLNQTLFLLSLPDDLPNPDDFAYAESFRTCFDLSGEFGGPSNDPDENRRRGRRRSALASIPISFLFKLEACNELGIRVNGLFDPGSVSASLDGAVFNDAEITATVGLAANFLQGVIRVGGEASVVLFGSYTETGARYIADADLTPVPVIRLGTELSASERLEVGRGVVNLFAELPAFELDCSGSFFPFCDLVEIEANRVTELPLFGWQPFFTKDASLARQYFTTVDL